MRHQGGTKPCLSWLTLHFLWDQDWLSHLCPPRACRCRQLPGSRADAGESTLMSQRGQPVSSSSQGRGRLAWGPGSVNQFRAPSLPAVRTLRGRAFWGTGRRAQMRPAGHWISSQLHFPFSLKGRTPAKLWAQEPFSCLAVNQLRMSRNC